MVNKTNALWLALVVGVATLLAPFISAYAHHGTTISYDMSQEWTLDVIVTDFRYINPHPTMTFDIIDAEGNVEALGLGTAHESGTYASGGMGQDSHRRSPGIGYPGDSFSCSFQSRVELRRSSTRSLSKVGSKSRWFDDESVTGKRSFVLICDKRMQSSTSRRFEMRQSLVSLLVAGTTFIGLSLSVSVVAGQEF